MKSWALSTWTASDKGRTKRKIWIRPDRRRTVILLKLQRSRIGTVVGVITGHCVIGTYAKRIRLGRLANDF